MSCRNCSFPAQGKFGGFCCFLCRESPETGQHGAWCSSAADPGPHPTILNEKIEALEAEIQELKRVINTLKYFLSGATTILVIATMFNKYKGT